MDRGIWFVCGAGSVGRSFAVSLAHEAGYEVVCADVDAGKIAFLKDHPRYAVRYFPHDERASFSREVFVSRSVSLDDGGALQEILLNPRLAVISTSVRIDNLRSLAERIAPFLLRREEQGIVSPLAALVFENVARNGSVFLEMTEKAASSSLRSVFSPNLSIDCMIPPQDSFAGGMVREEFGEVVVGATRSLALNKTLSSLPFSVLFPMLPLIMTARLSGSPA